MYNFDLMPERIGSDSFKWYNLPETVIPMWVADMDFPSAPPILDAVTQRASHPYFGYPWQQDQLKELIIRHYHQKYQANIQPEWIVWVPSVIPGVVTALQMMGGTFMYSVPMYDHIRRLYQEAGLPVIEVPMKKDENCHFTMDLTALEAAVTPEVKSLILCSPHNPLGRVFTEKELTELQNFCRKHNLLIISDEIHCELDLEDRHIPFFSLNEEAAQHSVTLSSAGKICNIPGLPMGFAIIPDENIRSAFIRQQDGLLPCGNVIALAAYEKAYDGSCEEWKEQLRAYLRDNRDLAEAFFRDYPEIKCPHNEGTYLLWLDCSALGLENPAEFFLEKAQVKVSGGEIYGNPQCVRFNYGCPRAQLAEALKRIGKAIRELR